jgi:hypothetical protein
MRQQGLDGRAFMQWAGASLGFVIVVCNHVRLMVIESK